MKKLSITISAVAVLIAASSFSSAQQCGCYEPSCGTKYRGRYDLGYDLISDQRLERIKTMGLLPAHAERSERSPKEVSWESLDTEQKRIEARAMEIYAAMVDQVDVHTGRLIDYLKSRELFDNTLIVFLSDNGAEGHDLDETWPAEAFPEIRKTIDETHDFSFQAMGRPGSYLLYGPNWAHAGAPSFKLHKAFPTEGGTRVPAFFYYPKELESGVIRHGYVWIKDVMPTLLDWLELEHPGDSYQGRAVEPMTGVSVLHLLKGAPADPGRVVVHELMGKRLVRVGKWKLVHMPPPYGNDDWQLYDLESDPAETTDIAQQHPEKVQELSAHWDAYAKENKVILPNWVSGY